jgi:hypothetical protein
MYIRLKQAYGLLAADILLSGVNSAFTLDNCFYNYIINSTLPD